MDFGIKTHLRFFLGFFFIVSGIWVIPKKKISRATFMMAPLFRPPHFFLFYLIPDTRTLNKISDLIRNCTLLKFIDLILIKGV